MIALTMEGMDLNAILLEIERAVNRAKEEIRGELRGSVKELRNDMDRKFNKYDDKLEHEHETGWTFVQNNFGKLAITFVLIIVVLKTLNIEPSVLLELLHGW